MELLVLMEVETLLKVEEAGELLVLVKVGKLIMVGVKELLEVEEVGESMTLEKGIG